MVLTSHMSNTHRINISAEAADEVITKLEVISMDDDFLECADLTAAQIGELIAAIPAKGGTCEIPDWGLPVLTDEVENLIEIWKDAANVDAWNDRANIMRGIRQLQSLLKQLEAA